MARLRRKAKSTPSVMEGLNQEQIPENGTKVTKENQLEVSNLDQTEPIRKKRKAEVLSTNDEEMHEVLIKEDNQKSSVEGTSAQSEFADIENKDLTENSTSDFTGKSETEMSEVTGDERTNEEVSTGMQRARRNRKRTHTVKTESLSKKRKVVLELPKLSEIKGTVLVVGQGDVGQLGLGEDVVEKSRPAPVSFPSAVVSIAAGGMHTVCLTENGEVYTFGCNDEGALGRVTTDQESAEFHPGKVDLPYKAVQVCAGDSHSAALLDNGSVYVWGNFRDSSGSMGLTPFGPQPKPVQILPDVVVVCISSGSDHLVCLTDEGVLYTCGCAEMGQLGRVAACFSVRGGRKGIGFVLNPDSVKIGKTKRQRVLFDCVWTSSYATFARAKDTGYIYGFGLNNFHQLGFDDQEPRFAPELIKSFGGKQWSRISGGQHHTLAMDDAGQVYALGRKEYGRLGLGENCEDQSVPAAIPTLQNAKCVDIASGNVVSLAVTEKGEVYSWGMGTNGQLGHGDEEDVYAPKIVGGKALSSRIALRVSSGGQHSVILACDIDKDEVNGDVKH